MDLTSSDLAADMPEHFVQGTSVLVEARYLLQLAAEGRIILACDQYRAVRVRLGAEKVQRDVCKLAVRRHLKRDRIVLQRQRARQPLASAQRC